MEVRLWTHSMMIFFGPEEYTRCCEIMRITDPTEIYALVVSENTTDRLYVLSNKRITNEAIEKLTLDKEVRVQREAIMLKMMRSSFGLYDRDER